VFRVRVYSGVDPLTGREHYLREIVDTAAEVDSPLCPFWAGPAPAMTPLSLPRPDGVTSGGFTYTASTCGYRSSRRAIPHGHPARRAPETCERTVPQEGDLRNGSVG
jgi:hypothetical protein